MKQGIIKSFDDAKGFGFISRDNGEDVFVHYSAIQSSGFRRLQEGQEVQFEVVKGPKGWIASEIQPIPDSTVAESAGSSSRAFGSRKARAIGKAFRATSAARAVQNSEALVSRISKALRKPGIKREAIFVDRSPKPVYGYSVLPSDPTKIVREAPDGSTTIGRVQNGAFREYKAKKA